MIIETAIKEKLTGEFKPLVLELANESTRHHRRAGSETHFKILLVSEAFEGLSRVRRHARVHEVLNAEISGIHAITMKLLTPKEWDALPEGDREFQAIGHGPAAGKLR